MNCDVKRQCSREGEGRTLATPHCIYDIDPIELIGGSLPTRQQRLIEWSSRTLSRRHKPGLARSGCSGGFSDSGSSERRTAAGHPVDQDSKRQKAPHGKSVTKAFSLIRASSSTRPAAVVRTPLTPHDHVSKNDVSAEIPEKVLLAEKTDEVSFAREVRILAAVKLYELGRLSSGRAAELAGMSRVEFLLTLGRYKVFPFQAEQNDLES